MYRPPLVVIRSRMSLFGIDAGLSACERTDELRYDRGFVSDLKLILSRYGYSFLYFQFQSPSNKPPPTIGEGVVVVNQKNPWTLKESMLFCAVRC